MRCVPMRCVVRLAVCTAAVGVLVALSGVSAGQTLFSEDYASGQTTTTALAPSVVVSGGNSVPAAIVIDNFIVNPATNGGSNQGPRILTFDASAPSVGVPDGFRPISFNGPPHIDDPGGYSEILAQGNWWTDNPTTFFHQNASINISPQIASRDKVYVLEYSVGGNIATGSDEGLSARIGLFDAKNQGVNLGHNFNNESTPRRPNQLNVHRINGNGENVHVNLDGNFSSGSKRLHYGQFDSITPPSLDFSDFKLRGQDQSGVLSHLFEDEAVIRFHELDQGRMSVEWFVAASIPSDPLDPASTPFGGSPGTRPERDGWHNFTTLENIFDLSGPEKEPLGDFTTLRLSLWNPGKGTNGWTVSDLSTIDTQVGQALRGDYNDDQINNAADYTLWRDALGSNVALRNDGLGGTIGAGHYDQWRDRFGQFSMERANNNHQIGFGRIKVSEYHVGDVNRDGSVTAADVTETPLLQNLNVLTDRVWNDGETTGDDRVTVADALAGVLTAVDGVAPSGPSLVYTSGSGNLQIATAGHSLAGFALVAASGENFNTGAYNNPNPSPGSVIQTIEPFELSWLNLTTAGTTAGGNLSGTINLGNVLPTGLTSEEFEAFFAAAVFNVGDPLSKAGEFFPPAAPVSAASSTVPEPATVIVLLFSALLGLQFRRVTTKRSSY